MYLVGALLMGISWTSCSDDNGVAPVSYTHLDVYKRQAEECGKMWTNVFAQTDFRPGDIFAPQDCVGAGGLNLDNLWEWRCV